TPTRPHSRIARSYSSSSTWLTPNLRRQNRNAIPSTTGFRNPGRCCTHSDQAACIQTSRTLTFAIGATRITGRTTRGSNASRPPTTPTTPSTSTNPFRQLTECLTAGAPGKDPADAITSWGPGRMQERHRGQEVVERLPPRVPLVAAGDEVGREWDAVRCKSRR